MKVGMNWKDKTDLDSWSKNSVSYYIKPVSGSEPSAKNSQIAGKPLSSS